MSSNAKPQDELEAQSGPNFTDFSDLLDPVPVTIDSGSQVSYISLNGKFLELSLRENNSILYHQSIPAQLESSKSAKVKKEPLDVSVNEQLVRGFTSIYHTYLSLYRWLILTMISRSLPPHLPKLLPPSPRRRRVAENVQSR